MFRDLYNIQCIYIYVYVWRPVDEVGGEFGPLCDRPGDHRGGGGGKDELEV